MTTKLSEIIKWVRRSRLSFGSLKDPRRQHGRKHSCRGLLNLMVTSIACLKLSLRDMENVGQDISRKSLRQMGLHSSPSDTTLYNLCAKLKSRAWSEALTQQINRAVRHGMLRNDLLRVGMVSLDGKGGAGDMGEPPNDDCRANVCDANGTACWHTYALRAVLTSSSTRVCLYQTPLRDDVGEPTAFPVVLARVVKHHGSLFRYVSSDAGITSRDNACEVRRHRKHYIFAVKPQFQKLYALALDALSRAPIVKETVERAQGKTVQHLLRTVAVPIGFDYPDAVQLWMVERVATDDRGNVEGGMRIFVSSIPESELSPKQILYVVRLHWGIENGANWTADVMLKEDTHSPCNKGHGSIALMWLRVLAFNMLALFRAALPPKDKLPIPWKRAAEMLLDHFKRLGLPVSASNNTD